MKRAASVFLRADINTKDAYSLIDWLENDKITKYLNESPSAANSIRYILERVSSNLLTIYFNNYGRFFMIDTDDGKTIGFIKLAEKQTENAYEIIIVIGNDRIWGQGYGKNAVSKCLQMVFFEWRADTVIANIHTENRHSINLFEKIGLKKQKQTSNTIKYKITMDEYLKRA